MARLRRLWPTLLVTLLGLPLVTPLLKWTAVPCTHDGHLHYHRVAAMKYAWEQGLHFTRWLPDLAFGYGYPFFVYREPAPLYAVLLPHLLGLPLPAASNLFYALTILACGWFMYLWVRDVLGEKAAFVSAVAYMAAPYVLIDALVRGNSPESLALPLFPLLLWAGRRWVLNGRFRSFLITTLGIALLAFSHNISLLIFTPTLLVYLLTIGLHQQQKWQTTAGRIILVFGLGLGMTAFYTGGALLEMGEVTLQQSTTTRNNDFHYNFATAAEIFAPPAPEDPQLLNPPLYIRLGWMPTALAAIGTLLVMVDFVKKAAKRAKDAPKKSVFARVSAASLTAVQLHTLLMLAGTAVFLFMSLSASLWLWENVPLIDFVQFPWRFVGRAALPIAFLAGLPFANTQYPIPNTQLSISNYQSPITITITIAVALLLIEAIPGLYPNTCPEQPYPTINTVHEYEQATGLVGVDPEGSYFPRTVERRPTESPLLAAYRAGETPQRFDTAVLPENAAILTQENQPLHTTITLSTPEPFTARYFSFMFPGWAAYVDGQAVPITPSDPDGLITFPVLAGTHEIVVRWQSTPLRTTLLALSLLALAAAAVTAFILYNNRQSPTTNLQSPISQSPISQSPISNHYLPLALLALLLLVTKMALIDRTNTPLRRPAPPPVAVPLAVQAGEIRVDGYNLSRTAVPSGGAFDIDLAWTAVAPPTAQYQSNIWLADANGLIWSDKETARPRLYEDVPKTIFWQPGQWGWDSREVQVLAGTPPGVYDMVLILFDLETRQPRTLTTPDGQPLGPQVVIGQMQVTSAETQPDFVPQYVLDTAVPQSNLHLLGYNQDRPDAAPGDSVLLTFFWQKSGEPVPDTLPVLLQDEDGNVAHEWTIVPTPDDLWQPGDRLRGQFVLRLPAHLESGRYQFVLADGVALAPINIHAPERLFTPPSVAVQLDVPFTTPNGVVLARLAGYTVAQNDGQLALTLVWQAAADMDTPYHVFVHLVDENGRILSQSDGQPANWTRPTTGWTAGEYVVDPHTLTVPPETAVSTLQLRVGLYNPQTGIRLLTPEGDNILLLP